MRKIQSIQLPNKKAQKHVEMILSFVLFFGFLIFFFSFFNPFKIKTSRESLDAVFIRLEDTLTTKLVSFSISIADSSLTPGYNCFSINKSETYPCGSKLIVRNASQEIIPVSYDSQNYYLLFNGKNQNFLIFDCYGEENYDTYGNIPNDPTTCNNLSINQDFNLGIINKKNFWSYSKIIDFKREYERDYDKLKDNYVQKKNDFALILFNVDGTKNLTISKQVPKGINVNAKSFIIHTIDENNGDIYQKVLNIITW
ncbi:MAG: hypothetical protein QXJ28_00465 [Candidatus Pacearchaeota archaeon]